MEKTNKIYVGSLTEPDYLFNDDLIISISTIQAMAIVGQELCVDTFTPTVKQDPDDMLSVYHFRSSDGEEILTGDGQIFALNVENDPSAETLTDIEDGTPVWYYHDNKLVGKFYVSSIMRLAKNKFRIDCVSFIGRLDKMMHGGGLFLSTTFGTVLAHILASGLHGSGDPVVTYEVDDDVAALPVSGWLPYATKRENLYQLIFAYGVNIVKNPDGNPRFTFIYTAPDNPTIIGLDHLYSTGNVEYIKAYSGVNISEHTYTPLTDAESVVIFDNSTSGAVTNKEVFFDHAPIIVNTITASGSLTLISATENSAVVSGIGKLSGIPYTHSTRIVSRSNRTGDTEKTIEVSECTMVSTINSENLLSRLFAFYCPEKHIKKITDSIVYGEERCGKAYGIVNPWGESETAFLAKMDINASSFNKADCEWYASYTPQGQQGLYTKVEKIQITIDPETGEEIVEGDWTVPEGVTEFKVVMISGGTGGTSGWPGENGQDASSYVEVTQDDELQSIYFGAEGGDGGLGGDGGQPGRVLVVNVEDVEPGDVFHWEIGRGGDGGDPTGFIPDTFEELKRALQNDEPDHEYTDDQIRSMLLLEDTDWTGSPNPGEDGTDTTFGEWSTADEEAYVPTNGYYDPIEAHYYALKGATGIRGGKGGSRQVVVAGDSRWITDGEDVVGEDGTVYHGGKTGRNMTTVEGLPEAKVIFYGGNGAGAAVGLDRATHPHMDGGSDAEALWYVLEDE